MAWRTDASAEALARHPLSLRLARRACYRWLYWCLGYLGVHGLALLPRRRSGRALSAVSAQSAAALTSMLPSQGLVNCLAASRDTPSGMPSSRSCSKADCSSTSSRSLSLSTLIMPPFKGAAGNVQLFGNFQVAGARVGKGGSVWRNASKCPTPQKLAGPVHSSVGVFCGSCASLLAAEAALHTWGGCPA